jgi:hypothetical protein
MWGYAKSMNAAALALVDFAVYAVRLPVVVPMLFLSLASMIMIPVAASRGKLHIPGYVGIAMLTFASSLFFGRLAGVRGIAGRGIAIVLSVAFFVLLAASVGSILALFVYRRHEEP